MSSSSSTRIVKNTIFMYVKIIVSMIVSLYTAKVFLNVLGASDYGLYNLMAGIIFMFAFFRALLTRSTLRYLCFYKGQNDLEAQKKVFSISSMLHWAVAAISMIVMLIASIFLFSGFLNIDSNRIDAARWVYYMMIISFVFAIITAPYDSVLNANENLLYDAVIGMSESLLRLGLAIILPFVFYDKLIFFSIVVCGISIFTLAVKRIYCRLKYEECKVRINLYDKTLAKEMITYAGWNFTTAITSIVAFSAMPVLLNIFWGTLLNAAQGIANQVNNALTTFSSNLLKALNPVITKSSSNDVGRMQRFTMTGSKMSFSILSMLAVAIIVECPYILKIWLKNVPDWTVVFCELLLIRSLFNQLITVYIDCIYASNKIKEYCIIKSILNVLPLFVVYLLFRFGAAPYVLYVVMFICWELLGGAVALYFNKRMYQLDIKGYLCHLVLPCIAVMLIGLCSGFLLTLLMHPSFIRLVLNVCLTIFVQLPIVWFIALNSDERSLVINMLKGIKAKFHFTTPINRKNI